MANQQPIHALRSFMGECPEAQALVDTSRNGGHAAVARALALAGQTPFVAAMHEGIKFGHQGTIHHAEQVGEGPPLNALRHAFE